MREPTNYVPSPEVQQYIANYAILEIPEGETEPYFSPPLALSGFIIQAINTENIIVAKIGERDFFTDMAVATGQVTQPVYGQLIGHTKSIMVFFRPTGMHQLFGTDMSTLTNKAMKLEDFLGKVMALQLLEQLKIDQRNEQQIKVLDEFFLRIKPKASDIEPFDKALEYLHRKAGNVSINELMDHSNYHRKTLERQFAKIVGLSPKVYAQIYQFKCLINLLHSNPGITWAQLADQAGYYDQSHMSRYIKEYLQVSPNSIVTLDMDFINYLLQR